MDPDAVHDAESEHDHEHKRAAITDQRQRNTGDGQHRDGHANILENVGEDESGDADDKEQTELIAREKGNQKTRQQEEGERSNEKYSANESPLLADGGKNIVVMDSSGRQKAELDLGI